MGDPRYHLKACVSKGLLGSAFFVCLFLRGGGGGGARLYGPIKVSVREHRLWVECQLCGVSNIDCCSSSWPCPSALGTLWHRDDNSYDYFCVMNTDLLHNIWKKERKKLYSIFLNLISNFLVYINLYEMVYCVCKHSVNEFHLVGG